MRKSVRDYKRKFRLRMPSGQVVERPLWFWQVEQLLKGSNYMTADEAWERNYLVVLWVPSGSVLTEEEVV